MWPLLSEDNIPVADNYAFDLETGKFDTSEVIPAPPASGCEYGSPVRRDLGHC